MCLTGIVALCREWMQEVNFRRRKASRMFTKKRGHVMILAICIKHWETRASWSSWHLSIWARIGSSTTRAPYGLRRLAHGNGRYSALVLECSECSWSIPWPCQFVPLTVRRISSTGGPHCGMGVLCTLVSSSHKMSFQAFLSCWA